MKKIFLMLAVSTVLFACKKETEKEKTFKGATVQVHDGKAWSTFSVKDDGTPDQLAIVVDDAALNSLPEGGESGHHHDNNLAVPLHPKALKSTPFQFIGLDWNPAGHDPQNVYTLPHFDFHFYMMPHAEVEAMVDMSKVMIQPGAEYLPANYVAGHPVPKMGLHWIDITSPELNPDNPVTFTQTMILGSYNGQVNFYEPMITSAFLRSTNTFERSIPQPAKVHVTGYYPTKMRIAKKGGETAVILEGFVLRQAS